MDGCKHKRGLSQAKQTKMEGLNLTGQECGAVLVFGDGGKNAAGAAYCRRLISCDGVHCPMIMALSEVPCGEICALVR